MHVKNFKEYYTVNFKHTINCKFEITKHVLKTYLENAFELLN